MTTLVLEGYSELEQHVAGYGTAFDNLSMQNLLRQFMVDLAERHGQRFEQEIDPDGNPWQALKQSTIDEKGFDKILFRTGQLEQSLAELNEFSIREFINEGANQGITFGTSDPKAKYHTEGTARMPARKHVGLSGDEIEAITNQAAEYAVASLLEGNLS